MSAIVVPFPLVRRQGFVCRHAEIISCMSPKSAERHLAHQLKVQRDALMRRGISEDIINREIASLERAIVAVSLQESMA